MHSKNCVPPNSPKPAPHQHPVPPLAPQSTPGRVLTAHASHDTTVTGYLGKVREPSRKGAASRTRGGEPRSSARTLTDTSDPGVNASDTGSGLRQASDTSDTSPGQGAPGQRGAAAALISVCLGFFVIQLDVAIVNVALAAIQREIPGSLAGK